MADTEILTWIVAHGCIDYPMIAYAGIAGAEKSVK